MNEPYEVIIDVPQALQHLIRISNEQLKEFQLKLNNDITESNIQMMGILKLNPDDGWRLDISRMKYVKVYTQEKTEQNTDTKTE